MKKYLLSTLGLVLLALNGTSFAANGAFGGSYGTGCDSEDTSKCGLKHHPWIIEDCIDFQASVNLEDSQVRNNPWDHYMLSGDVDCSMTNPDDPEFTGSIFDNNTGPLTGTGLYMQSKQLEPAIISQLGLLDGNGYTVSGIYSTHGEAIMKLPYEIDNIRFTDVVFQGWRVNDRPQYFIDLTNVTSGPIASNIYLAGSGAIMGFLDGGNTANGIAKDVHMKLDIDDSKMGIYSFEVIAGQNIVHDVSSLGRVSGSIRNSATLRFIVLQGPIDISISGAYSTMLSNDTMILGDEVSVTNGLPEGVVQYTDQQLIDVVYPITSYRTTASEGKLANWQTGSDGLELINNTYPTGNIDNGVFQTGPYGTGCRSSDREFCGSSNFPWQIRACQEWVDLSQPRNQLTGTSSVYDHASGTYLITNNLDDPRESDDFEIVDHIDCQGFSLLPMDTDYNDNSIGWTHVHNGYRMENVNINQPGVDSVGLYKVISNVGGFNDEIVVKNCNVVGRDNVGCVAGEIIPNGSSDDGNIKTVVINPLIEGEENVGGVFGKINSGNEPFGLYPATISGEVVGNQDAGSIVGESYWPIVGISSTNITATGSSPDYIGGLLGNLTFPSIISIQGIYLGDITPGAATNKGNFVGGGNAKGNADGSVLLGYSLRDCSGCTDDFDIPNASLAQAQSLLSDACYVGRHNLEYDGQQCNTSLYNNYSYKDGSNNNLDTNWNIYKTEEAEKVLGKYVGLNNHLAPNLEMNPSIFSGYPVWMGLSTLIEYDQAAPWKVQTIEPANEEIGYASNNITIRYFDPNLDDTVDVEFEFHSTDDAATCGSTTPSETDTYNATTDVGLHTFTVSEVLVTGTTYYWCARATDNNGNVGAWSDLYSFTFGTPVPADPNELPEIINVIPVDEATDEAIDSAVEIDYDDLDVADQVSVELNMYHGAEVTNCDSPGAASSVAFDEGSPQTNNDNSGSVVFTPSIDLTNSTTYYICTRASDDKGGVSSWILTSFTTKEANVPPTLGSFPTPADGALDQDASLSLEIDYSDSNSFDTVNLTARVYSGEPDCSAGLAVGHDQQLTYDVDSNSGTASFPVAGLPEGRTYYWCVEASDGIESSYRGPFSFSTATSGPAPGSIESVMGYYSEAAVTVVDLENTVTVFDENTPAGVNISAKIPGAEVGVCNVKGQLVDLTFVAPGVSADIHCHEDSFYVGNIVGFAPGAPAVLVSFDGVTGEGKTNINGLVKQGKSGIGGQILVGGQFLAIDPPGTWIFELDGVEDFIMNEGEANEFTVASIIDNTAFTVSENTDGTQSIIVASGTVTVTDSQGTDIVVDGGTQGDNNAEAIVLTRNATQDLTVGSGGVITLTGGVEIPDRDGDLVPDNIDTCINVHNTDQTDTRGCGAEGLYHSFARQETRSYRESFFNNMKGSDLTEALNPQGKSTNKTVGYLREMVKRAANQSTEIKAAAVAANALLNLTGEDQIDETDGSNDTLYQVLKKVRQWRFENL